MANKDGDVIGSGLEARRSGTGFAVSLDFVVQECGEAALVDLFWWLFWADIAVLQVISDSLSVATGVG